MDLMRISGMQTGHIQGIAIDKKRGFMYHSFTTCLLKTDMDGNILGSVNGLAGHLGCIAFNPEDGRIYGSLEYKHDAIGKGILGRIGNGTDVEDGFYIAIFDGEKIDRMDMDAEADGVMTAVYLDEVVKDYAAPNHRYGCSGIDGITFAPIPGKRGGKRFLYVAYGIYGDTKRFDNDNQVILRYDIRKWRAYEAPLKQDAMHKQGPDAPDSKYFVFTGNTTYGIQNLEYDADTNCLFAAVYKGKKPDYPNYPMYLVNLDEDAVACCGGERLRLANRGETDAATDLRGIDFPYGTTGMISLGKGQFLFSKDFKDDAGWGTVISEYRFTGNGFEESEKNA